MKQQQKTNENELLYMIHQHDDQALLALINQFEDRIRFIIYQYVKRAHHVLGNDDYRSLAIIKLLDAIQNYREDKDASFAYFYMEVLKHTFIDHYRTRTSYQGLCDDYLLSLDVKVEDEQGAYTFCDLMEAPKQDHSLQVAFDRLQQVEPHLNKLEKHIVTLRIMGYPYQEIASRLSINSKKVDNTLRKIRRIENELTK